MGAPVAVLAARFTSSAALLAAWDGSRPGGALFVPTTRLLWPGSAVVVALSGRALKERIFLRGAVETVQPAVPRRKLRAGVLVVFDPAEQASVDYLLATVRGEQSPLRRRQAPRMPVSLETTYRRVDHAESCVAEVVDLSTGGLQLRVPEAPPLAARLVVKLPVPGTLAAVELEGEVVSVTPPGDRVGVRFDWHGVSGVRRMREVLRRLRVA